MNQHHEPTISNVLFDLDGTLLDTAPDMAHALNQLLIEHQRPTLSYAAIRPHVSHGSAAMLRIGFGIDTEHAEFAELQQQYLTCYAQFLTRETQLFPGGAQLLARLHDEGYRWGIVTNKPDWLTQPILAHLRLDKQCACLVCGNTTDQRKPHPKPLLHACELANMQPAACLYVGDAQRDIQAGRAAKMKTLIARFGYIPADEQPSAWGADAMIDDLSQIHDWLTQNNGAGNSRT